LSKVKRFVTNDELVERFRDAGVGDEMKLHDEFGICENKRPLFNRTPVSTKQVYQSNFLEEPSTVTGGRREQGGDATPGERTPMKT